MNKAKPDSGYYWVDRAITCNGCKHLNFKKCGCKRDMPPGKCGRYPPIGMVMGISLF